MGKLKALSLAGTALLGMAAAARAADLPPPPPIIEPAPEPVAFGGWYLRGDVGVGIASKPEIRSTFGDFVPSPRFDEQHLGDAAFVGLGAGYQFNNWFRADVTGEYRTSQSLGAVESYNAGYFFRPQTNQRGYDDYTGSIQSSVFLANGYVDLGTWWGLTPFLGAGVGGSYNRVYGLTDISAGGPSGNVGNGSGKLVAVSGYGNGGFGYAKEKDGFDLAYAGYAGLSYAVSPNLKLELAYRYLNMGTAISAPVTCANAAASCETQKYKLESNDIKLGMRWMFNDIVPVAPVVYAPPPPPLVRKY